MSLSPFATAPRGRYARSGAVALAVALVVCAGASADESDSLPLPKWTPPPGKTVDPDAANPLNLGGGLWPRGSENPSADDPPNQTSANSSLPAPPPPPEDSGGIANFFKLFIPQSAPAIPTRKENALPPQPVKMEILQPALDAEQDTYYLDPQLMIPEAQAEDVKRLLTNHANGAKVAIYVLVLAPGQALPEQFDLGKVASGALLQRLACLAVYPLNEPWRARLFTSKEVMEAASGAALSRMSQDCIRDSMDSSDEVEQIQRFITQLSIHLFWLERSYHLPTHRATPVTLSPLKASSRDLLPEVETQMADTNRLKEWLGRWSPIAKLTAVFLALLLIGIWGLRRWLFQRRRVLAQSVWMLPEIEVQERRLGAPHCGGHGRMIRYG